MAGHRKASGKPLKSEIRRENSRRLYDRQLSDAQTPARKIAVAQDFLRRELTHAKSAEAAEQAARQMLELAQAIAVRLGSGNQKA